MKKVLIAIGVLILLLVGAALALPVIFKDDIEAAIDKAVSDNLNAKVYYDRDAISLSLFKNFPDLSISVGNFGITGLGAFEGDTLVHVGSFGLTLDIMSVIGGEKLKIKNVLLDEPDIKVIVLEDGQANYDIAKSSGEETEEESVVEDAADFSIQFQGWEIRNGNVLYDDRATPMIARIYELDHTGAGDFTADVFDMETHTRVGSLSLGYDGIIYMSKKILNADVTMAMDMANMKFTFKQNNLAVNNFAFGMDGFINMPEDDIDMDITFAGKEIDMKSILSLVPGDYETYLEGVTAEGIVAFDGYVRGTYNDTSMPAVMAHFGINNGKIDYVDSPVPMDEIMIEAAFNYPSADLRETSFAVDKFHMRIEDQPFNASLLFKDLEDYFWDLKVDGSFDLAKVTSIIPLEGMELKGMITTAMQTSGRMSDIEAEKYTEIDASGEMVLQNFEYISENLPQGFGIVSSKMTFNPKQIALESFKGHAGQTDLNMSGRISNYINYALSEDAILYGVLNFNSAGVYVDEWMSEEDSVAEEETVDTTMMEPVRVPANIDFELASNIKLIQYDNLDLKDFAGNLIVRDGAVTMQKVNFNLLDGYFEMNGTYESAESLPDPLYDFDFKIQDLSIPLAFDAFNTVKKLAPFAENMKGKFSTGFSATGTIGPDMMPVYEDIQGKGSITVADASIEDVKLLKAASKVTKMDNKDGTLVMKNVKMQVEIVDGRVYVKPFDVYLGGRKTTIYGSSGVDGSLDYEMVTNVPSGNVGNAVNTALSSYLGGKQLVASTLDVTMGVSGTYDDPVVKLVSVKPGGSSGSDGGAKAALKKEAEQKLEQAKQEAKKVLNEQKEKVEEKVDEVKQEVKQEVTEKKDEAVDKAKDELKSLLKKKKK